jgi:predicted proteasome-type protease
MHTGFIRFNHAQQYRSGLPIDLACCEKDSCKLDRVHHITDTDHYFSQISQRWSEGLRGVFASLPDPGWAGMACRIHESDCPNPRFDPHLFNTRHADE